MFGIRIINRNWIIIIGMRRRIRLYFYHLKRMRIERANLIEIFKIKFFDYFNEVPRCKSRMIYNIVLYFYNYIIPGIYEKVI